MKRLRYMAPLLFVLVVAEMLAFRVLRPPAPWSYAIAAALLAVLAVDYAAKARRYGWHKRVGF